jgi:hypothetical protein
MFDAYLCRAICFAFADTYEKLFPNNVDFFPDLVLDICYNETCYNNYW